MHEEVKLTLTSEDDVRRYFASNSRPYFHFGASNFYMMGIEKWVRGWTNVNLIDCYDGSQPQTLVQSGRSTHDFQGIEDINLYLVKRLVASGGVAGRCGGAAKVPRALFLYLDAKIEVACQQAGVEIVLPPNAMVRQLDSKIATTAFGNAVGVCSVPNVLTAVSSYPQMQQVAAAAGLGERWVVQTAYGDSGRSTFFIATEADFARWADCIATGETVKVMRWIDCKASAVEACATRWGTFVGPLMTELIGDPLLTPFAAGWCGNALFADAFTPEVRRQVMEKTQALGDGLYRQGYRGYFEVDYLMDRETQAVYLGELNPRISGVSGMTTMSNFSEQHLPLFLLHLLEYESDVDLRLDVRAFNERALAEGATGVSAQLIVKYTDATARLVSQAPVSGVYQLGQNGNLVLLRASSDRRDAMLENQAYVLRIMGAGETANLGDDMAIVFLNCVIADANDTLGAQARQWVQALRRCFGFASEPLPSGSRAAWH